MTANWQPRDLHRVASISGEIELSWPASLTLESAVSLTEPVWKPLAARPPVRVGPEDPARFFRLAATP